MGNKFMFFTSMLAGLSIASVAKVNAAPENVEGHLDNFELIGNTINLSGWAFDHQGLSSYVMIQIYADNQMIASIPANQIRDDVRSHFNIEGDHGFADIISTNLSGKHKISIYALDIRQSTSILLGEKDMNFTSSAYLPIGCVDQLTIDGNTIHVAGWAADQDDPNHSVILEVYSDSNLIGSFEATNNRQDVCKAIGMNGNFGFDSSLEVDLSGEHTISIYAKDNGGKDPTLLAVKKATFVSKTTLTSVNHYNAIGCVDSLTVSNQTINLAGWAYDQDNLKAKLTLEVYCNDQLIGTLQNGQTRKDVCDYFHLQGDFGFSSSITTNLTGTQMISVYVVDLQTNEKILLAKNNLVFASTAKNTAPFGYVDSINVNHQEVSIAGWAIDQDALGQALSIEVYAGKEYIGTIKTNQKRTDVNNYYHVQGNFGFSGKVSTSLEGNQTIYIYVVDDRNLTKVLIGQQDVVFSTIQKNTTRSSSTSNIIGWLDSISSPGKGTIYISGWTFDQANPDTLCSVRVYVDGKYAGNLSTTDMRSDVNDIYSIDGFHGYSGVISTMYTGTHTIEVYGADLAGNNEKLIASKKLVISGNDLVSIAYSQLGLRDGNKYNRWYGIPDGNAWCATFVSWCADQAGILNKQVPKFSWCGSAVGYYKNNKKWLGPNSTPKRGYLIFFDYQADGIIDHVGIVEKVENGIVYTIEGNSNNQVKCQAYAMSNPAIIGYGIVEM